MSIVSFEELWSRLQELGQPRLDVAVLSSCTGTKMVPKGVAPMLWSDMQAAPERVVERLKELEPHTRMAEDLYAGQNHLRLTRGVRAFRRAKRGHLTWRIVSAGYGVVDSKARLPPYEATFARKSDAWILQRAADLGIPEAASRFLARCEPLKIFVLGDDHYLACQLDWALHHRPSEHCVVFCGRHYAQTVPDLPNLHVVVCSLEQARQYSLALVALKGELCGVLLERLAAARTSFG